MHEAIHVTACVGLGMLGASFSSLDSRTNIIETAWHIALGGTLAGLTYPTIIGAWPGLSWTLCLLPAFLVGFFVYGIAILMKKASVSVGGLQPADILDAIMRRNTPPKDGGNKGGGNA